MKRISFIMSVCFASLTLHAQTKPDDNKILPVLWQQTSAEYDALCYQAYNLAQLRISFIKKKDIKKNHQVIVTDIDETLLNNSYFEANLIQNGKTYTFENWKKWTSQSAATPIAGSLAFFKFAKSKGFEIFYISDRKPEEMTSTINNLKKYGYPDADTSHVLLAAPNQTKIDRRHIVASHHQIALLLGDNLNDFKGVFMHQTINDRKKATAELENDWGKRFIVLPNPVYGEWENALYQYNFKLSTEEKQKILMNLLKGY